MINFDKDCFIVHAKGLHEADRLVLLQAKLFGACSHATSDCYYRFGRLAHMSECWNHYGFSNKSYAENFSFGPEIQEFTFLEWQKYVQDHYDDFMTLIQMRGVSEQQLTDLKARGNIWQDWLSEMASPVTTINNNYNVF